MGSERTMEMIATTQPRPVFKTATGNEVDSHRHGEVARYLTE